MHIQSILQQALGEQWELLPRALQAHYQHETNTDSGTLDIEYPGFMQPGLNFMRLLGALVNQRGKSIPTTVEKRMAGNIQYWKRTISFPDGRQILFRSHWIYLGRNELIEFVNPWLGLKMAVYIKDHELHYKGIHYVLKLGNGYLPIPEWLVLGHTSIVEAAVDDNNFTMDFKLHHPLLGQLYRYAGKFSTSEGSAA